MVPDVLGGKSHDTMARLMRRGDRPVSVDSGDGPRVAVADRFTGCCDEAAVVVAGGDDVTDVGVFAACEPCRSIGVEVSDGEPPRRAAAGERFGRFAFGSARCSTVRS